MRKETRAILRRNLTKDGCRAQELRDATVHGPDSTLAQSKAACRRDMTAVIVPSPVVSYLHNMAAKDDIQRVAAALERPRDGYVKRLEQSQRALAERSGDASRQLGVFVDRIAGLTLEELRELYDETFLADEETIGPLVERLVHERTGGVEASAALTTLTPWLERLESERNPHAYALRALCFLLLSRARTASPQQTSN